ncbi:hypothetical protein ZIOFF_009159 [Zingiber officinale]|uniref:Uncharacterized protein n=1 Tax=Zingiber officinale TaxID=94328 RepID=A0A8J5HGY1_ZINOF|nr:hypothetical protein ZIOFF_009159 [Zingiber officinale]
MMRPISTSQSTESSKAFFRRPLRRLEKVTCRLARFSILLICVFPLTMSTEQQNQRARSSDQSWPHENRQGGIRSEEGDEESRLPYMGSRKSGGGQLLAFHAYPALAPHVLGSTSSTPRHVPTYLGEMPTSCSRHLGRHPLGLGCQPLGLWVLGNTTHLSLKSTIHSWERYSLVLWVLRNAIHLGLVPLTRVLGAKECHSLELWALGNATWALDT